MDEATIRSARDDDLETMKQIAVEAWEPVYESIQEAFRKAAGNEIFKIIHPDWRAEKAAQVAGHYQGDPETAFVTEYGGEIVGFITYALFEHRKTGVICNNAIRPKYQGRLTLSPTPVRRARDVSTQ